MAFAAKREPTSKRAQQANEALVCLRFVPALVWERATARNPEQRKLLKGRLSYTTGEAQKRLQSWTAAPWES